MSVLLGIYRVVSVEATDSLVSPSKRKWFIQLESVEGKPRIDLEIKNPAEPVQDGALVTLRMEEIR